MAYLALTAGQVDADSPLDATLMGQIKANFDAHETEKLERDGTIPMTGNLAMGTNAITGATAIDGTGDLTMGTITLVAGSGTGIDTNGTDIITEDILINGVLSGANLHTSAIKITMKGTNETAGTGVLKETHAADDADFTSHLTDTEHFVFVPALSNAACYHIATVTDTDNLDLSDSSTEAKNARDYGNASAFWILDGDAGLTGPGNDATQWTKLKEFSWASADATNRTLSIAQTYGGVLRTGFLVQFNLGGAGAGTITADYGDTTLTIGTNGDDGVAMFIVLSGTNTLTLTKSGTTGTASADIWFDHTDQFSGGIS